MRNIGLVLQVVGAAVALVSLAADFVGMGIFDGTGSRQRTGMLMGSGIFIFGWIIYRRSKAGP